jgi:penicillin amidase/acyl-homoserine-lactone acylase
MILNSLKKPVVRNTLIVIGILLIAASSYVFWPEQVDLSNLANLNQGYDVRILRDTWGVPHVFGVTDADTAFGLAYANAEDDFLTIQQTLIAARGLLASVYGSDAAPNDYMVELLRIWDVVDAQYKTDLAPESIALFEAYADGINFYAAMHPEEVLLAEVFPATGKDLVAASVHKSPLFFGLDSILGELFQEEKAYDSSPTPTSWLKFGEIRFGSNTFAIAPSRTEDKSTFLAVNSHQPWEGPVAWYEAHLHSEEGWDMVGALFPGTPVIIHGHNRNLGWAFTVSDPDLTDVYALEINPDNQTLYLYDGEWRGLEIRPIQIKVKLIGRLKITVTEEVYWSVYGPVIRQEHGTYALKYSGFGRVDIFEQLYRMNKATNFEEWKEAMFSGALPTFNVGYADKEGNIYYLYNASLPIRAEGYDWSLYLPGNTSDTLWTEYLPYDNLPQVFNPPSGFIQNANSTPFQTTIGPGNPVPEDYSVTFGIEDHMTNRALRFIELFGGDDSITFEEFVEYKFDLSYSTDSDIYFLIQTIKNNMPYEDINQQIAAEILLQWDLRTDKNSKGATLMVLTMKFLGDINEEFSASSLANNIVPDKDILEGFRQAVSYLVEFYERVDVPWGEVNRLNHGEVDLAVAGGPDIPHAIYGNLEDGQFHGTAGDSFVLLVKWDPGGEVQSFSIHQFGSATKHPDSPHYADQAALFVMRELKPVWLDEEDILTNLEQEYRPGEELPDQ